MKLDWLVWMQFSSRKCWRFSYYFLMKIIGRNKVIHPPLTQNWVSQRCFMCSTEPVAAHSSPQSKGTSRTYALTLPLESLGTNCRVESLKRFSKFSFHGESILKQTSNQKLLKTRISSELRGCSMFSCRYLCQSLNVIFDRDDHGETPT